MRMADLCGHCEKALATTDRAVNCTCPKVGKTHRICTACCGFGAIADQDSNPISIAHKLEAFAREKACKGNGILASNVENEAEDLRYDALEDQIASVNRQLPDNQEIGWHPEESGTLMYADSDWFQ
jgi:hypothetical protein